MSTLKHGIQILQERLSSMPSAPGVYRMLDEGGKVIYVGKAKNLVKRVASYTHPERLEYRIQAMVANIAGLEIVTTKTEAEALLLEANLIKKFEPKYNILLKDDKSYPYILLTQDGHGFPRIVKHRGAKKEKGKYYGPFPSAGAVNRAIVDLQKAFLIRPCSDSFFAARKRPCMEYQIKRCSAPCVDKISKEEYDRLVKELTSFLEGKSREVQEKLVAQMEQASNEMDYEKAATYRDRIKALNQIQARQSIHTDVVKDADVVAMHRDSGQCCIQVFFFRSGNNLGNSAFFPKHTEGAGDAEVLASFLMQFYTGNPPPREIITSHGLEDNAIGQALAAIAGHRVEVITPKAGAKLQLVKDALRNAEGALREKMLGREKQDIILAEIAKLFDLPHSPKRIEVYDNSHIMGTNEVGAMIVAGEDGFNKKAYRKFNIKGDIVSKGDDYAMLEQVLFRRFGNIGTLEQGTGNLENSQFQVPGSNIPIFPDLILIDGGAGQMSVALRVFKELRLEDKIKFACIAKGPDRNAGREQFFMPGKEPFTLPHTSPVLYYLQLLRDEAHRFAIGSHRKRRAKSTSKSLLDEIPGIGGKRKKLLLNHFGSAEGVKNATIEELMQVDNINRKTAEIIYGYFKK